MCTARHVLSALLRQTCVSDHARVPRFDAKPPTRQSAGPNGLRIVPMALAVVSMAQADLLLADLLLAGCSSNIRLLLLLADLLLLLAPIVASPAERWPLALF